MASQFPPMGAWFQEPATGRRFEVIDVDERNSSIEVQFEDGDLAEFDAESWRHLDATRSTPPTCNGGSHYDEAISEGFMGSGFDSFDGDGFELDDML